MFMLNASGAKHFNNLGLAVEVMIGLDAGHLMIRVVCISAFWFSDSDVVSTC